VKKQLPRIEVSSISGGGGGGISSSSGGGSLSAAGVEAGKGIYARPSSTHLSSDGYNSSGDETTRFLPKKESAGDERFVNPKNRTALGKLQTSTEAFDDANTHLVSRSTSSLK